MSVTGSLPIGNPQWTLPLPPTRRIPIVRLQLLSGASRNHPTNQNDRVQWEALPAQIQELIQSSAHHAAKKAARIAIAAQPAVLPPIAPEVLAALPLLPIDFAVTRK